MSIFATKFLFTDELKKPESYIGFTLAEVLITLGIIGIIAAITIPNLIKNTQNAEFKNAAKKFYSEISNATALIINDNGGTLNGFFTNNDSNAVVTALSQKMQTSKTCTKGSSIGTCYTDSVRGYYYLNNNPFPYFAGLTPTSSGMILNNGIMINIWDGWVKNSCNDTTPCAIILFDVNGFKKPNKEGVDAFYVGLYAQKTKPYDNAGTDDCIRTGTGDAGRGISCLLKVMQEIDY